MQAAKPPSKPGSALADASKPVRFLTIVGFALLGLLASLMVRGTSPTQLLSQTSAYLRAFTTTGARSLSTGNNQDRARGLIASSGVELLTFGTPNGQKASIILEELKEAYGKNYTWQSVPIMDNVQKEPWYTKLNPNGRIPTIIDHDHGGFAVMEGAAILAYLTRRYDPERRFSFEYDSDDYSTCEQWIAWQHGGLGPMQGQANHFYRAAKERIPYATQRYVGETERLYGILDNRLSNRDYLAGPSRGKYSIADIANFGWVNVASLAGIDLKRWPSLHAWHKRIEERPAVKRGTAIPSESRNSNKAYEARLQGEEGFKEKEDELRSLMEKAKAQYGYKYASP